MTTTNTHGTLVDFLAAKFAGCEGVATIWSKQRKATKAIPASDIDGIAGALAAVAQDDDAYIAISTQASAPAKNKRGSEGTALAVPGFFADIDLAAEKGAETGYPTDREEAIRILDAFPFKPTWLIDTGNGLHAHFDFEKPLTLRDPVDQNAVKRLSSSFQRTLVEHFYKHGRKIDNVGDLARLCRPPETLNHKTKPPKRVTVIRHEPENRLTIDKVEAFLNANHPEDKATTRRPRRLADHEPIIKACAWYRDVVVEGAETCSEPDWFAGTSITALCKGGEEIFFDYSRRHPRFREREAREKFRRAVEHNAPRTCASIADELGHKATCEACPHYGLITTPLRLGVSGYDPGPRGPVPLGYSAEGNFVFLDQVRQILVVASSSQLLSLQYLLGVAPMEFWGRQFPNSNGKLPVNFLAAGQALMEACRERGPFDPRKVRGRGVWLEKGGRIIVNLGGMVAADSGYVYLCFEPLPLQEVNEFPVSQLERLLSLFPWRNQQDATLMLGWLAIAPICGVLKWRPHCFVYGPPNCGKTTLHTTVTNLLTPLVVSADGQSTEAGIRQLIKADSRPCVIDEFESDQQRGHINGVLKLARSASSAENPVLRGTPEGKAMHFTLRTCFFFGAVNPSGMSPADATRILLFEMLRHDNDPAVAQEIATLEAFLASKGPEWCGYMAGLANLVPAAIESFKTALPGIDSRHRQNVATLLAGAFIAKHRAVPSGVEARSMAEAFMPSVELHAEAFERDDAAECLQHLLSYQVEKNTLGYWITVMRAETHDLRTDAKRILMNHDIVLRRDGNEPGLFIKNGSAAIEVIFRDTKWGRGAWERSLRKLVERFTPKNPIQFPCSGQKARAIGLPLELFEIADADADWPYVTRF